MSESNSLFPLALFCFSPTPERNIQLFNQSVVCMSFGGSVQWVSVFFVWKQLPVSAGNKVDEGKTQNENNELKEARKVLSKVIILCGFDTSSNTFQIRCHHLTQLVIINKLSKIEVSFNVLQNWQILIWELEYNLYKCLIHYLCMILYTTYCIWNDTTIIIINIYINIHWSMISWTVNVAKQTSEANRWQTAMDERLTGETQLF